MKKDTHSKKISLFGAFLKGLKGEELDSSLSRRVKREDLDAAYTKFVLLHHLDGDFDRWLSSVEKAESKIGIILGARGSGKTAFGMKFLENIYSKYSKNCYAMGFNEEETPDWINVVDDISEIENDSFVLIDEGGILFNSRESMTKPNKLLSDLILIARHKNLNILFISQNSSNLDVNILRQADFLVLKPSSLLQKNFERKIIQKIYEETEEHFQRLKDKQGLSFIYSGDFRGFVQNSLPTFWSSNVSKSFRKL